MKILVLCETSGEVRRAFRQRGHNAWSCDLLPADDGSPHHFQDDCLRLVAVTPEKSWDLIIAHPPCTHLASSGARHFAAKRADGRQQQGVDLFLRVVEACAKHARHWAVENPIGIMSRLYRKPDQIVHPWQFGHGETKATCLWLSPGLPPLRPTDVVDGREPRIHWLPPSKDRWKLRSKTYPGIAAAMASQWGALDVLS